MRKEARPIRWIAFDADDTLWHNERFFQAEQDRFAALLAPYCDAPDLMDRLLAAERRNLGHYGFGIKGFVLSMIETALEVTDNAVPGAVIAELLGAGREMLDHPIELLPHARDAVKAARTYAPVCLITKGDLLHQERKLAQSGLGDLFDRVEIVSDKAPGTYARIFGEDIPHAMMIGNAMKSDVVAMIDAGGWGVFVPHGLEWAIEAAPAPTGHPRYAQIPDLGALPVLLDRIMGPGG
ncbi:MAG: HAD family hydrolase [Pseudomonadota bacterium]